MECGRAADRGAPGAHRPAAGRDGEEPAAGPADLHQPGPVGEIVSTPRPGAAHGARIAADSTVRRVGIVELDAFPSGPYEELAAAGVDFVDATQVCAQARRGADSAERLLLGRADAIAVAALDQVDAGTAENAGSIAGLVEKHARLAGAEEAYIAVAPDV